MNPEGPDASPNSMSGGLAILHGRTRDEVYQDFVRLKQDVEAAWLQDLYKGNWVPLST